MFDLMTRQRNMILGALVADAASLGLHWLYDQDQIAKVAPNSPAFTPINAANYENVPGFFAHGGKSTGEQSQYGEQLMVMLRSLAEVGQYDKDHYQAAFRAHFGYGGPYVGYIDHPTRDTLDNITRAEAAEHTPPYCGADDRQLPAISKLPPLVALAASAPDFQQQAESAMRVTNDNATAVSFGTFAADLMRAALLGNSAGEALSASRAQANPDVVAALKPLERMADQSTPEVTKIIGMSCDIAFGVPSVVHNLTNASTFSDAIEQNIYAGGDSCGRAILLGAILGATHGIGGETGIPQDWIERLSHRQKIMSLLDTLTG